MMILPSPGWALKRGVSPYDVPAIRLNDRLVVLVSYEGTSSAERERERLRTSIQELDREQTISDRPALPNKLIQPWLDEEPRSFIVDVAS